jgi:excisionase family DNA binding protein
VSNVDTPTITSDDDLPLLTPVPRAARMLGISRAAAYRLAASGELPSRRLGGRVYVITAAIRALGRQA